jgi:hypothetical protein
MTDTINLHDPSRIPKIEWDLSVKMESHFFGTRMTAFEQAIAMTRCIARFVAINMSGNHEERMAATKEMGEVFVRAIEVELFRRKAWAVEGTGKPDDHLATISAMCEQGLKSCDGDQREAALRDILAFVRRLKGIETP